MVTQPWAEDALDTMLAATEAQFVGTNSRLRAAEAGLEQCQQENARLSASATSTNAAITELQDQVRTLGDVVNMLQAGIGIGNVSCPAYPAVANGQVSGGGTLPGATRVIRCNGGGFIMAGSNGVVNCHTDGCVNGWPLGAPPPRPPPPPPPPPPSIPTRQVDALWARCFDYRMGRG